MLPKGLVLMNFFMGFDRFVLAPRTTDLPSGLRYMRLPTLTQTVADMTALNNYRAAKDNLRATELSGQDARDLVVLAVGGAYLRVIAAAARVNSARAQLEPPTRSISRHRNGLVSAWSRKLM